MEGNAAQMAAAFHRLPTYTRGALPPLRLTDDREWTDATRHIRKMSRRFMKTGLPSLTCEQIMQLVREAKNPAFRVVIILMWCCAARSGDVLQLRKAGIMVGAVHAPPRVGEMTEVSVFFDRGKVIGKIDPYTVHTAIPEYWATWLKTYLSECKTEFLVQLVDKRDRQRFLAKLLEYLRTVVPACDLRAVRRGAAQSMAEKGVPLTTILQFTRHTDLPMLRRYLRFGRMKTQEATTAFAAARLLWPESC